MSYLDLARIKSQFDLVFAERDEREQRRSGSDPLNPSRSAGAREDACYGSQPVRNDLSDNDVGRSNDGRRIEFPHNS